MKKTINPFLQVAEFNLACGNTAQGPHGALTKSYLEFLREEFTETETAMLAITPEMGDVDLVDGVTELADGLIDTIYIAAGMLHVLGLSAPELFAEVHRSNMAKVDPKTGKVERRSDGKILKPEGWKPPNLKPIVARQLGYIKRVGKNIDAQIAARERANQRQQAEEAQAEIVEAGEKLLTPQQMAQRIAASDSFIRKEIRTGKLKAAVWVGKSPRVTQSEFNAYLGVS